VRWNAAGSAEHYARLVPATDAGAPGEALAALLQQFAKVGGLPTTLTEAGVTPDALTALAARAAEQWTGASIRAHSTPTAPSRSTAPRCDAVLELRRKGLLHPVAGT